jgi:hypothetical protein
MILLIKGSRLSKLYDQMDIISVKTLQVEARPKNESKGLINSQSNSNNINSYNHNKIFVIGDTTEIFFTPTEQKDIVRDSFATIDIISPDLDTNIQRGVKPFFKSDGRKILIRGIAQDWKRGIRNISINKSPPNTYRAASGYFDFLYELKDGINKVDVSVENQMGFKRLLRLNFEYNAQEEILSEPGRNYLMVIGINNYVDNRWPILNNAVKDAKDFEKLMVEKYGYLKENIKEIFNEQGTRKIIFNELKRMKDSLRQNDRMLIYYAGHGYYDKPIECGYWIPVDAKANELDEYLNYSEIARLIQKMNAKNIFIIADACFSGSLVRDMQKENSHAYKSRMVLCSGKLQPVDDGEPGFNSPFAAVILNYLNNVNIGQVYASELIQFVKDKFKDSEQKPVGGAIDEVGDENGDFILQKRN